jgi:hypothetical protein
MRAGLTRFCVVLLCAATLQGCGRESIAGDILKQESISDGRAMLITRDSGGATTAFVYRIYIRSKDGKASELLRADHVVGLSVKWRSNALQIGMKCGRVFHFSNFYESLNADGTLNQTIPVTLEPGGLCSEAEYHAGPELASAQ